MAGRAGENLLIFQRLASISRLLLSFSTSLVAGPTHTFHPHTLLSKKRYDLHHDEQPAKYPFEVSRRCPFGHCDVRSVIELDYGWTVLTWGSLCHLLALPRDSGLLQNTGPQLGCTENCNDYSKLVSHRTSNSVSSGLTCLADGEHQE
jgi:hypothetical protein